MKMTRDTSVQNVQMYLTIWKRILDYMQLLIMWMIWFALSVKNLSAVLPALDHIYKYMKRKTI